MIGGYETNYLSADFTSTESPRVTAAREVRRGLESIGEGLTHLAIAIAIGLFVLAASTCSIPTVDIDVDQRPQKENSHAE